MAGRPDDLPLPHRPGRNHAFRAPETERAQRAMAGHLARELGVKTRLLRRSVVVATGLFVFKAGAAWLTGSVAVMASALDSLLDAAVSGLNWFSVVEAERPADPGHPFGHGKIESLVGAAQALLLGGVGLLVAARAVGRLRTPVVVEAPWWGVAAMGVSGLAAFLLARSIGRRARVLDSPVLMAEQLHYSMDFTSHAGVMLALAVQEWTGVLLFDPFVSLLIAAWILWQVRGLGVEVARDLLDGALPVEVQDRVVAVVEARRDGVVAYHGLRTRRAGNRRIVNLHLVLCKAISFETSHGIVDRIERELVEAVPRADVTIHADPCGEYCPGEDRCPWLRKGRPAPPP